MLLILISAYLCLGTLAQSSESNLCLSSEAQKSCAACIATAPQCAWCASESYEKENRLRCDTYENARSKCERADIQFPEDDLIKLEDKPVQDGDNPEDAVQIQPQRVRVSIRPNKPVRIPLIFRQAENYPVDLYYLMDLSNSMEDDKVNLAELGNLIAERMSAITKNFRLGFGSFVDKVVSPFVSTVPRKQEVPCTMVTGEDCEKPYGFKNQLKLDLETAKFAQKVRAARVSGNLDAPEGGFDAIMQAVECEHEIGWRPISRRMLVFSTDAGFHYAGDGKLGGIVTPNDGKCHLHNDVYTQSSNLDYPSVSQIASKIKEKAVSVIFAVTEDQFPVYEKLSRIIESSSTGKLANDSSNIVKLVQENYEKITSKVSLRTDDIVGDNITVTFYSRCFGTEEQKTNECGNLKIGQTVTFGVEVTVTACPADRRQWRREFSIKPVGYQEKLTLDLDLICECECEKAENEEVNSDKCSNGNGTFECGKCTCNPGRYGKECECKADDLASKQSQCIAQNATVPCSGRGFCSCGECICDPRASDSAQKFSGPYCECDDYSCGHYNEQICGGPERGTCKCGKCICGDGYNGTSCECELSTDNCRTGDTLCNGHGKCICGKCSCESQYTGPKCEQCPACPDKCHEYEPCVKCRIFQSGKKTPEQCIRECRESITGYDKVKEGPGVQICQFKDDDECWAYFTYEYDANGKDIIIKVQNTKVCPEQVNVLAIVGGVVGGIVAVGLFLLLIWKLLTFIHDTREFAKFEKERQNAKWDTGENPIYKQATSTFKNPTYGGR